MKNWKEGLVLFVPQHMHEGVIRWIENGIYPGSFQRHIFENDFAQAVYHADQTNFNSMGRWACFLASYAPDGSWGSVEAMKAWHEHRGLERTPRS